MERLPSPVLRKIFQWLPVRSLIDTSFVCRKWKHFADSDDNWRPLSLALMPPGDCDNHPCESVLKHQSVTSFQIPNHWKHNFQVIIFHREVELFSIESQSISLSRERPPKQKCSRCGVAFPAQQILDLTHTTPASVDSNLRLSPPITRREESCEDEDCLDDASVESLSGEGGDYFTDSPRCVNNSNCTPTWSYSFPIWEASAADKIRKYRGLLTPSARHLLECAVTSSPAIRQLRMSNDDRECPISWKQSWSILNVIFTTPLPPNAIVEAITVLAANPDNQIIDKMAQMINFDNFPVLEAAPSVLAYVRERHAVRSLGCLSVFHDSMDRRHKSFQSKKSPSTTRTPTDSWRQHQETQLRNDIILTLAALGWRGALVPLISIWDSEEATESAAASTVLTSLITSLGGTAAAIDEIERRYNMPTTETQPIHLRLARMAADASAFPPSVRSFCVRKIFRLKLFDKVSDLILSCTDPHTFIAAEREIINSHDSVNLLPLLQRFMMDSDKDPEVRCSTAWLVHHIDAVDKQFFENLFRIPTFPTKLPAGFQLSQSAREAILCHWTLESRRVAPTTDRRWLLEGAWLLYQKRQQQDSSNIMMNDFQFSSSRLRPSNNAFTAIFNRARHDIVKAATKRGICLEELNEDAVNRQPSPEYDGGESFGPDFVRQVALLELAEKPVAFCCKCSWPASKRSPIASAIVRISPLGPYAEIEFQPGDILSSSPLGQSPTFGMNTLALEPLPSVEEAQLLLEQVVREIGFELISTAVVSQIVPRLFIIDQQQKARERSVGQLLVLRPF